MSLDLLSAPSGGSGAQKHVADAIGTKAQEDETGNAARQLVWWLLSNFAKIILIMIMISMMLMTII